MTKSLALCYFQLSLIVSLLLLASTIKRVHFAPNYCAVDKNCVICGTELRL